LVEDQLLSSKMAPSDKIKVSQLPLLFAKGNPTSLEMMNLEELQIFLRFVIKCELNQHGPLDLDDIECPKWWPEDLTFSESIMMKQKENRRKLSLRLKQVIRYCYNYNKCGFLIDFCRKLVEHTGGIENLEVRDNKDGTRSILKRVDKKLLVTFKAENQDYDKHQNTRKQKPSHLSPIKRMLWNKSDNSSDPAMSSCVTPDIYLCDTCDKDFDSLTLLISHEKNCGKEEIIITVEKPATLSASPPRSIRQEPLMTYLRLRAAQSSKPSPPRKLKESERPKAASYEKFMDIDVASPLGSYIMDSSRLRLEQKSPSVRGFQSAEDSRKKQESNCPGTILTLRDSNAFKVNKTKYSNVFKSSRKRGEAWVHLYCFTELQRRNRLRDIQNGLSLSALRVLKHCQKRGRPTVRLEKCSPSLWRPKLAELNIYNRLHLNDKPIQKKKRKKHNKALVEIELDFQDEKQDTFGEPGGVSPLPATSPWGSVEGTSGGTSRANSDITISDSDIEMMAEEISADGDQTKNNNKPRSSSSVGSSATRRGCPGAGTRNIQNSKQNSVFAVFEPRDEISDDTSDSTLDIKPVVIPPQFRDLSLLQHIEISTPSSIECVTISSDDDE